MYSPCLTPVGCALVPISISITPLQERMKVKVKIYSKKVHCTRNDDLMFDTYAQEKSCKKNTSKITNYPRRDSNPQPPDKVL